MSILHQTITTPVILLLLSLPYKPNHSSVKKKSSPVHMLC